MQEEPSVEALFLLRKRIWNAKCRDGAERKLLDKETFDGNSDDVILMRCAKITILINKNKTYNNKIFFTL